MKGNIIFINPHDLIPHESVKLRHAAFILTKMFLFRTFDAPILIDGKTKTILDGHHRRYSAHRLGLKLVPCYAIDYLIEPGIKVFTRRPEIFIDKSEVIKMALSATVFPHKTTRHEYEPYDFKVVKLKELK